MNQFKPLCRLVLLTVLFSVTLFKIAFADGGFPTRPGRLLISPSVSYFFSNKGWDSTGVKKRFDNNGKYQSIGITVYAEYGINRRFAVIASLPYVFNSYSQDNFATAKSNGFTDLETGLRYYIANINFIYYFSIQGTAITPLYTNNNALGYGEEGGELKLAFSGSGHLFNRSTYFNVTDGVRQYFGTNGPIQNRYTGTFGISLDTRFRNQVSASLTGINSYSNNKSFSPIFETNKDYRFLQGSLSYGHSFNSQMSIFASGGAFLTGRNTGAGYTASLAFIYRLDYN